LPARDGGRGWSLSYNLGRVISWPSTTSIPYSATGPGGQRVRAGRCARPPSRSTRGVLTGNLIAQSRYFSELVEGNPLMSALETGFRSAGQGVRQGGGSRVRTIICTAGCRRRGDGEARRGPVAYQPGSVDGWPCAPPRPGCGGMTGGRSRACSALRNRSYTRPPGHRY